MIDEITHHQGAGATPDGAITAKRLILVGGGHAHLAVLTGWARQAPSGVETWMIAPAPFTAYSGMIPGWMAGYYPYGANLIDLRPLAKRAGVKLIIDSVCGLNAARNTIDLASGGAISFDLLSLATGGDIDTSKLALLGDRLLPIRPVHDFVAAWPRVLAAAGQSPHYKLVVVGGGAAGVELALAAKTGLQAVSAGAGVQLVADLNGLMPGHSAAVRHLVERALAARKIDVLFGRAVGTETGLLLANGTVIEADCVIAATGSRASAWLKHSGLVFDAQDFIAVGAELRSLSHDDIFAAGDIVGRVDQVVSRSGVHAVKAGPVLAANLRAWLRGGALRSYLPRKRTLYLLATGDRRAILSWGPITMSGRLVWRLKDFIDRRFVETHASVGQN